MAFIHKSSARFSLDLLPGFEFLKIKSVLYDTDNTPKNVTGPDRTSQSIFHGIMKTKIGTSSLIDYIIESHQLICFINDRLDH